MAEHSADNRKVVGSSPTTDTICGCNRTGIGTSLRNSVLEVRFLSSVPTWSGGHVNLSTIYIENRRYSIIGRGCWLLTAVKWSTTLQHDVLVHVSHSQDVRRYTIGLHNEPVAQSVEHMTF